MRVPARPLVGRDADLAVLDRALARARRGDGSAVVVLGEPGIGKTRFLQEIRRLARIGEVAVTGSASEFGGALPYGAFVAALDDYVQTIDPRLLGTLDDEQHATLAALLPSYPVGLRASPRGTVDAQYQAHRAMRSLLQCLASAKPHIVVLDDLHWADTATIAMVISLLRRPPSGPVVFLFGARVRQAPAGLLAAVSEAVRAGYAARVDLAPLMAPESRRLLDPGVPDDEAHRLYVASGGNPFYLEQLARISSSTQGPVRADVGDRHADLPPLVAAALTEELEALDATARQFLRGAALVGDPFEADLAECTADLTAHVAVEAIDVLLHRDMIRHTDVPRRFQFRHPLLRRAVYETTPGGWRLAAHERCGRELERRGASPVLLAAHIEQAGRHGDHHAIEVLTRAGESLTTRSPLDAAHFFAAALRLTPSSPGDHRRIALGVALSTAYASGGRFSDARQACLDALSLLGEERSEKYLELVSLCARLDQVLGNHAEAHTRLTQALARVPATPTARRVDLLTQLSIDGFYALDIDAMAAWAARGRADAAALGDELRVVRTTVLAGLAAVLAGDVDDARSARAEAARVADALLDDQLVEDPYLLGQLATAEYYLDLYPEASAHIERALRVARSCGRGQHVPLLYWSGTIRAARGELEQALDVLETAVDYARISDHSLGIAWNLSAQSTILSGRGDRERALDAAREAAERTSTRGATLPAELARLSHAAVLFDCAQAQRALEELDACAAGQGPAWLPLRWQLQACELATRCQVALGRTGEAQRLAAYMTAAAGSLKLPTAVGFAQRAAAVALAMSEPARAERHAIAALDAFAAAGAVIEAEKTRVLLGRTLAASGRADRAIEELTLAAARFETWSAHGLRAEADRELRKLGRRRSRRAAPPSTGDSTLARLTAREREVAMLVAQGKTNPQIAAELFLSGKTVESHIRNAFGKLQVTSRLELARLVDRARTRSLTAGT
jgi:DNA-binding NarL/FixJ family response regulator